jgi:hypothetical protein
MALQNDSKKHRVRTLNPTVLMLRSARRHFAPSYSGVASPSMPSWTQRQLRTSGARVNGTRWTNEELLFHLLFGYILVGVLTGMVKVLGLLHRLLAKVRVAGSNPVVRSKNLLR